MCVLLFTLSFVVWYCLLLISVVVCSRVLYFCSLLFVVCRFWLLAVVVSSCSLLLFVVGRCNCSLFKVCCYSLEVVCCLLMFV